MLSVQSDHKTINNHFLSLLYNNVLGKVDNNTALVEVALDNVDRKP